MNLQHCRPEAYSVPLLYSGDQTWAKTVSVPMQEQPRRHRGRPVKYQGDPNAPGLTKDERRQLLRQIANRESARRMRKRHLDELRDLSNAVCHPTLCIDIRLFKLYWVAALTQSLSPNLASLVSYGEAWAASTSQGPGVSPFQLQSF
jgi:hypothetical protein